MGTDGHGKAGLNTDKIKLEKAVTFRFGNDETLKTRTMAILLVGIEAVRGVLHVHVVLGGAPLVLSKESTTKRQEHPPTGGDRKARATITLL